MFLIAGPCAIESRDIVMHTAETLKQVCERLGINLYFKSSYDKANRTSLSDRGVGMERGLEILQEVKSTFSLPILTDVHESWQCAPVAEVADVLQIPAFLSRQTDLLVAAAKTGKIVNVKKGQFMAPWDMRGAIAKIKANQPNNTTPSYTTLHHSTRLLGVILAIGHSAHDTYHMLHANGVALATKGFAMGVRAEHPQALINKLMYHDPSPELIRLVGNASYSLVTQVQGRGVYSFCMCPGGHIVPAGSALNSCVVNGMSASHRNSPYANSGMVVEIRPEDLIDQDPLAGLRFQQHLEYLSYQHGGEPSLAPTQRLRDFVEGKASKSLPACSYLPGTVSSRLDQWLPEHIGKRLQQGFRDFDRKYRGFLTNEAVILGVESRSSSAVRLPRDPETLQSISTPHLYPCGEGAGYAGGITSSALDGINVAIKIAEQLTSKH